VSAIPHGASFWTRTARINVELEDGTTQAFFLKVGKADISRNMLQSEFEGVSALYPIAPNLMPRPIGWGSYKSDPNTYYYLGEYVSMIEEIPDYQVFCAMLAKLHRDSMPLSPNGKFGFHVTTYRGIMPQDVAWCDTWEECFIRALRGFVEQERNAKGPSEELDQLLPALSGKVIPRLLRPLHTGGRHLKPVLVHGDLWYGNLATNANTGLPTAFDPTVFWAHNECGS
jgi:protein-ribulosamine 3-kinase